MGSMERCQEKVNEEALVEWKKQLGKKLEMKA